jgi:aminomuconate-semialdehyde/2-hydroxymuconate-6-semialdehyde dehydrogenase
MVVEMDTFSLLRSSQGISEFINASLSPHSRVCQEEIFGPVVTVISFSNEEQVIEWANSTAYGLSCSIWTENGKRGRRVASGIHVGTAWINCWMVFFLKC